MDETSRAWFVDTNVLLRLSLDPNSELSDSARAIQNLRQAGHRLYGTTQVIAEFWNVSTRPIAKNGFGLNIAQVVTEVRHIQHFLTILPETLEVFEEWKRLVTEHEVCGVRVHDARIAAAMKVHRISNFLTLNAVDFRRFPGILPVQPADLT